MNDGRRWTPIKVALGVCFALKSWKEFLLLFTYLTTLGKDVTFPLITKFKTNRPLSYLFVNKYVNNPTSLQMARSSLIDEKLD